MEVNALQCLHPGENPALDGGLSPVSLDLFFICDQTESLYCFESDQTLWSSAIRCHQWAPVAGLSGGAGPCFQIPGKAVDWGQFIKVWESPCLAPFLACSMYRGTLDATCPWQNRSQGHTSLFIWADNQCIRRFFYLERSVYVKWYVLFCFPGLQNRPEWHLIDQLFTTHSLEMRRRPATFRGPSLCWPATLTSPRGAHHYGPYKLLKWWV